MKKIFSAIALLAAVFACSKKEMDTANDVKTTPDGKQIITATVNVATKVSYSENTPGGGGGISSVWAAGDKFYAIQDGNAVVTFNIVDGVGNTTATFEAEAEGVTASTSWKAVLGGHASVHGTEIHCGFGDQGGVLNSLNNYNCVVADGEGLEPSFDFENGQKLSYIMRIKLPAGVKNVEYTPSVTYKVEASGISSFLYDATHIRLNDSAEPHAYAAFEPGRTFTIKLSSPSTAGQLMYIVVPAYNYSYTIRSDWYTGSMYGNVRTGVIVTLLNDDSDNATLSNGVVMGSDVSAKGGQVGSFDLSGMTLIPRPKPSDAIPITKQNVTISYTSGSFKQKAETGLVTYWAPMNLGAENGYETGGLYAYGEINSRTSFDINEHAHYGHNSTYFDVIGAAYNLGGAITYSIAGSRYDAARVKWGKAWRMPHCLEISAMLEKNLSNLSDETVNGVKCVKVTGDGGAYFYIPLQTGTYFANLGYSSNGPWTAKDWAKGNPCTFLRSADQIQRGNNTGDGTKNSDKAYFHSLIPASNIGGSNEGVIGDYWLGNYSNRHYGMPIRAVLDSSTWER